MANDDPNKLAELIDRTIREAGPISVSTYMRLCLTHPQWGYYNRANPLGRAGDFVTAPDISQTFGELIGLWILLTSRQLPGERIELVELGPGRGTLIEDALHAMAQMGADLSRFKITLAEVSPVLIAEQKERLSEFSPHWIENLDALAEDGPPLVVIANEFFDALPIKQYQKAGADWHERLIGLQDHRRVYGLDPNPIPETSLPASVHGAPEGAIFESAAIAAEIMADLGTRLTRRGGALLAIDYGYAATQTGDTFQAVAGHAPADPLAGPGTADLTAHVDFAALAGAAAQGGAIVHPLLTQTAFLGALGIAERFKALIDANPDRAEALGQDITRLVGEDQMGTLFKVLCVTSPGLAPYPFAPLPEAG